MISRDHIAVSRKKPIEIDSQRYQLSITKSLISNNSSNHSLFNVGESDHIDRYRLASDSDADYRIEGVKLGTIQ